MKQVSGHSSWRKLLRLLQVMRPHAAWMAGGVLMALIATLAGIALLAVSGRFIASMALAGVSGIAINYFTPAALIRGFAIVRTGGRYVERLVTHEATLRALSGLRVWLFQRLIPLAPARLGALHSADLFARLRADVDRLEHVYLALLTPLMVAISASVIVLAVMLAYSVGIALITLLCVLIGGWWLPWWGLRWGTTPGEREVETHATLRIAIVDRLRGEAELLAFGAIQNMDERIGKMDTELWQQRRKLDRLQALGGVGAAFAAQLAVLGVLWIGVPEVHRNGLAPADLAMLAMLALALFESITPLPEAWAQMGATFKAAGRIFDLADTEPVIHEPKFPPSMPTDTELRLEGVQMRYREDHPWVLDGVDLCLAPGERLALVGASGAGKSSLAKLLLRFHPYQHGTIYFGGLSLDRWPGDALRRRIAVIDQRPYLFDASLRENLLLACPDTDDATLWRALHDAQLDTMVRQLPEGLETWVGENGMQLSGGQLRRVAIARALLMDAPVLVLDEPTEGLDAATARSLYQALLRVTQGRSLLLISHRLGSMATLVDQVACLQHGRIVKQLTVQDYLASRRRKN